MTTELTRRAVLRAGLIGGVGLAAAVAGCTTGDKAPGSPATGAGSTLSTNPSPKVLLAYFSRAGENYWNGGRRTLKVGNTEVLAEMITKRIECDVYRIEAGDPYPRSYDETVERNVREEEGDARPTIAHPLPDLTPYDTVLLGSPVWNVRAPMIMRTFVDGVDLTGKTVLPFVTYAVSGMGSVENDYRALLRKTRVRGGLAVRGEDVADAGPRLAEWLRASDLMR